MDRRLSNVFSLAKRSSQPAKAMQPQLDLRLIYDQHAEFLWKSLYRLGVPEADLPDATQQVLMALAKKLEQFDGRCRMSSFLFGICLRVAATARRTQQRRQRWEDSAEPDLHLDEQKSPDDPEQQLATADARRSFNEALDALTPEKRAVFVMYELEELPCSEIAQLLDIPKGTVHSRLHAARAEFKAAFEQISVRDQTMAEAGGGER